MSVGGEGPDADAENLLNEVLCRYRLVVKLLNPLSEGELAVYKWGYRSVLPVVPHVAKRNVLRYLSILVNRRIFCQVAFILYIQVNHCGRGSMRRMDIAGVFRRGIE